MQIRGEGERLGSRLLVSSGNLFSELAIPENGELFTELLRCRNVSVEHISSSATPDTELCNQEQDEWVVLLEGRAVLEVAGETLNLAPGDHLFIPARTPHRVIATQPDPRCRWLAVHIFPEALL